MLMTCTPTLTATLTATEMYRTFAAMEQYGGGFCRALALAWYVADRSNKDRIETAFAHLIRDFGPDSKYYCNDAA